MERVPVESSHIRSIGYDENTSRLEIEFKDGTVYEYDDVPQHVHEELMAADSQGVYANSNIYKKYTQRKI